MSDWDPRTIQVKRVMKRLIPVSGMNNLDWEVRVIADSRKFLFPPSHWLLAVVLY